MHTRGGVFEGEKFIVLRQLDWFVNEFYFTSVVPNLFNTAEPLPIKFSSRMTIFWLDALYKCYRSTSVGRRGTVGFFINKGPGLKTPWRQDRSAILTFIANTDYFSPITSVKA